MIDLNVQIIKDLRNFLEESNEEKTKYTTFTGAFTKPKKLTFIGVILFLLNMPKKSLGLELEHYFRVLEKENMTPTKSALSQARYKIKVDFFKDWNKSLQDSFYKNNEKRVKKWFNYQLHGVDGSSLHLMNKEEIEEVFGCHSNQHGNSIPMARMLIRYDLLNEIIIKGQIASIKKSEDALALTYLDEVFEDVISIYDRKFVSFTFLYEHERRALNYIMRAPVGFNKEIKKFVASKKASSIVKIYPSKKAIRQLRQREIDLPKDLTQLYVEVRLVRVKLKTGEIEVLVTNLKDEKAFTPKDFKELYNLRWGAETCYDALKNKFQIAAFSGHLPKAIEQDFHATVFVANLNSILIQDCEEEVEKKTKDRAHYYKINRNISIGIMKDEIVRLFIYEKKEVQGLLERMKIKFIRHIEPVRPGRSFVRSKKKKALGSKYVTLTNYRRVI